MFREFQESVRTDDEFADSVSLYLETMPKLLSSMRAAEALNDIEMLKKMAGHMNDLAGKLELTELCDVCLLIQSLSPHSERENFRELIGECVSIFYASIRILDEIYGD